MVNKELKANDSFDHDGRVYCILEVLEDGNYISKAVDAEHEAPAKPKSKAAKTNL